MWWWENSTVFFEGAAVVNVYFVACDIALVGTPRHCFERWILPATVFRVQSTAFVTSMFNGLSSAYAPVATRPRLAMSEEKRMFSLCTGGICEEVVLL